jgi:hypothetical protein
MLALTGMVAACSGGSHATDVDHIARRPAASVSARVVLQSRTIPAGSAVAGRVIVDNDTGRAVHVVGCGALFQVVLTSSSYHPVVVWPTCLQRFTIPAGKSSYRVTVQASRTQCSQGKPHGPLKRCLPGLRMPPLAPGRYQAKLFQTGHAVAVPPPTPVRVVPPRTP